jgi:hypothetical protein
MGFWSDTGNFLFGTSDSKENIYNKGQQQLLDRVTSYGQNGISNNSNYQSGQNYINQLLSGDPAASRAFEDPYRQEFEGQVIPGIANRFAGQGSGNQSSSAFRNALAGAGSNYVTGLAAIREGLKMQALPQALSYAQAPGEELARLSQIGLSQSPYQHRQGSTGFLSPILGAVAGGVSGPIGASIGNGLGGIVSDWFKGGNQNTNASIGNGLGDIVSGWFKGGNQNTNASSSLAQG